MADPEVSEMNSKQKRQFYTEKWQNMSPNEK